jgi:hypothetical protein
MNLDKYLVDAAARLLMSVRRTEEEPCGVDAAVIADGPPLARVAVRVS